MWIEDYKERTGITVEVIYDTFETNETMLNTLKTGKSDYDLVCPSDYAIQKMIKDDMLEKFDLEKLPIYNKYGSPYLKGLFDISLENINLNDNKSLDEIIRKIKRNKLQHDIDVLLKEQRDLESHRNDDNKDAKEVDVKVMEIALKIVELRRILQKV
jgi:DNA primase